MKRSPFALAALLAVATPHMALAHPDHDGTSFVAGVVHPLTGFDHMLAMVLIGVGASVFVQRRGWLLPAGFLAAMTAGFFAFTLVSAPLVEAGIVASVVALGIATSLRLRTGTAIALPLAMAFGFVHGAAHGAEAPAGALPLVFAAGFVASSAALHLGGYALARRLPPVVLRLIGVASVGLGAAIAMS